MNRNLYRIVFNKARGIFMAVAEIATAQGKGASPASGLGTARTRRVLVQLSRLKLMSFALQLTFGASIMVMPLAHAEIIADSNAPKNQQPTVLDTANGVPQVNIQTPSPAGVSRNTYSQFDVQNKGAILNNSRTHTQTQLGGWIQGNPWLATGTARIILNEVNSANPSLLRGYVEVAGDRAQVVIANPAGVTCDGCGFINAARATLTTGAPIINGGSLDGYLVQRGVVTVQGAGLDASQSDFTDIIARAVQVNAGIWAKELKITAGANQVSADHIQTTPVPGTGAAPAFAIDVAQLGGMYAGKITLTGTEAGVGVRNAGHIGASAGEVIVTADGFLTNSGRIDSTIATRIDANSGIANSGTVYSQGDSHLATRGNIDNSGAIAAQGNATLAATGSASRINSSASSVLGAGIKTDGTLATNGNLNLTATQSVTARGQNLAGGDQAIRSQALDLTNSQTSAQNLTLTATTGNIDASGATLAASQTLNANAAQTLRNDDAKTSANQLNLSAHDLSNIQGELVQTGNGDTTIMLPGNLDNTRGRIAVNSQNLSLAGQSLITTDGKIEHAGSGTLVLNATTLSGARGSVASNGSVHLTAQTAMLDAGSMLAERINIDVATLSSRGGHIIQRGIGDTSIKASTKFDNTGGTLASNGHTTLTVGDLINQGGTVQAADVSNLTVSATGMLDNSALGKLNAGGNVSINAQEVRNAQGQITAGQSLQATAINAIDNSQGLIAANQGVIIAANSVDNSVGTIGSVQRGVSVTTAGGNLNNSAGRIEAAQGVNIASTGLTNTDGVVTGQDVNLDTRAQAFENSRGTIAARGALDIQSGRLTNDAGLIQAIGAASINTHGQTLTNTHSGSSGGILGQSTVTLATGDLSNQAGFIGAKGTLSANSAAISNTLGGIFSSEQTITLTGSGLDNQGGQVQALDNITLNVGTGNINNAGSLIRSSKTLQIVAGSVTNTNTQGANQGLEGQSVNITTNQIDNGSGAVRAADDLTLTTVTTLNGGGLLRAGRDLMHRQTTTNSSGAVGTQEAGNDAVITSNGALALQAGETLYAGNNLTVQTNGDITSNGTLAALNWLSLASNNVILQAGSQTTATSVDLNARQNINNQGLVSADTLNLNAVQVDNSASIIGNDVTITATTLNNTGSPALIGALNDLTINAGDVTNQDNATLYASNDLKIQGDASGNPGNSLTNRSTIIEAGRDITLNMNQITNQRTSVTLTSTVVSSVSLYYKAYGDIWPSAPYSGNIAYLMYSPLIAYERERWVDASVTEDQLSSATAAAQIQAGRNLAVTAQNLTNSNSIMAAAGLLNATVSGTLDNTGQTFYRTQNILTHHMSCIHYPSHSCQGGQSDVYTTDISNTVIGGLNSTLQGGLAVGLNTGALNVTNSNVRGIAAPGATGILPLVPITVGGTTLLTIQNPSGGLSPRNSNTVSVRSIATPAAPSSLPAIQVPSGGLFTQNSNPASHYLIETDARFASRANFLSSNYFLQQLGIDFDAIGKRVGDGFVEARLVREQLFDLTGRRFLAGYRSDNEQLLALYDAGVRVARALQLQPGIALSATQVAALTSDIIWLQQESVTLADGSVYQVLVPRVYLAQLKDRDLQPNGSLIAGGDIAIYAAHDVKVQGSIAAEQNVSIAAANYLQRAGKLQGTTINLATVQDVRLQGGKIIGQDISIAAGAHLDITRTASGNAVNGSLTQLWEDAPSIQARGNALLTAQQDINLAGANISAGQQLALLAGNDLNINAASRADHWQTNGGDGQYQRQAVFYSGSTLTSGGDTLLLANHDINVIGSSLKSGKGILAQAGNDIAIVASTDRTEVQYEGGGGNKHKSSYASGHSIDERLTGSALTALGSIDLRAGKIDFDAPLPSAGGNIYTQGATLKAGQNINLQGAQIILDAALENHSEVASLTTTGGGLRQYQRQYDASSATGSILDAGNKLSLTSSGATVVVGSALAAGDSATITTGGNLAMLAATSHKNEQIQDYNKGRKKAETLNYNSTEIRQLLSTITVGNKLAIQVGGDFIADIASQDSQGQAQADRMSVDGVIKGAERQQISVTRSGDASGEDLSQVRGKLSSQDIRNGANDSFTPGAVHQDQAAVAQYLASGLVQVKSNPQLQAILSTPTANGSPLTAPDSQGRIQLTVAGQAKVQEVYNQLKLTETFDVKHFADAQTVQIVTLVAAIALTVVTGGAAAGTVGAAMAGAGTATATMVNAAIIGMASTMTGQLAGGASFDQAFEAGLKAGASSAISAGVSYGVSDALGLNPMLDSNGTFIKDAQGNLQYGTAAASAYSKLPALDKLGDSLFWQQTGLNATAQGTLGQLQGGSFQDGFTASLASSVGRSANTAVGDWAMKNDIAAGAWSKALLHAGIGAAQAQLTGQDATAGAIGGATAELLAAANDSLDAATGNKIASELLTVAGAMGANQLLNGNADANSNLTAAYQAQQTDRNNRQLHINEIALIKARAKGFANRLNGNKEATLEQIAQAETRLLDQADRNVNQHSDLRLDGAANLYLTDLKRELAIARQDTLANGGQYFSASPDQYFNDSMYAEPLNSVIGQQAYRQIQAGQTGAYLPGNYYKQGIADANKESERQAIAGAVGATVVLAPIAASACLTNLVACNQAGITVAEVLSEGGVVAGGAVVAGKIAGKTVDKKLVLGNDAAKSGGLTGTVFDSIKATQPTYAGSAIPVSFEMALPNGQRVWVAGNATEHMAEFAQMKAVNYTPEAVNLASQQQLTSLQSAVNAATQNGVTYNQIMNVGGWELKFAPPRQPGQLPALIHALPGK